MYYARIKNNFNHFLRVLATNIVIFKISKLAY